MDYSTLTKPVDAFVLAKNLHISVRKQSGFKHFGAALKKGILTTNEERKSDITAAILFLL